MGVFDDKRYDQLDWVSQAVQPIETPLAQLLEKLPERTELGIENFRDGTLYRNEVVDALVTKHINGKLSYSEKQIMEECFEFEMDQPEIILDLEKKEISGKVFLVKVTHTLDEDKLKTNLGLEGRQYLGQINTNNMDFPRANEMLELLEKTEEALRSRSGRTKRQALMTRVEEIFKNNEWNVKNTELANKVGFWLRDYIDKGNLAALSNITRLKVMTYKGGPIYSVEEA